MLNRLYYGWRVLATGASFLVFGIGGVLIAMMISAIFYLVPLEKKRQSHLVRRIISRAFFIYIELLRWLGLLSYEVLGRQYCPQQGGLLIANHPSLLDVVFLISMIRNPDCVVKESLRRIWLTKAPVLAADFIPNNASDLIDRAGESMANGNVMVMFPEGTRTEPGKDMVFQRGVANIALSTGCQIYPALIHCCPDNLVKGQRWYQIPVRPPHYVIEFLEPLNARGFAYDGEMQSKTARRFTRFLEEYYQGYLS